MRNEIDPKLIQGRVKSGPFGSDDSIGLNGAFFVFGPCGEELKIIASDASAGQAVDGWEHVSVSTRRRCPNWREMCFVKNLFFKSTETVVQFHPPEDDYINNHPHCLHLWRDTKHDHRLPPSILVGIKGLDSNGANAATPEQIAAAILAMEKPDA